MATYNNNNNNNIKPLIVQGQPADTTTSLSSPWQQQQQQQGSEAEDEQKQEQAQKLEPPPPPPSINSLSSLPPGWTTAVAPQDGRIYYWEKATGKTSWTHPMASTAGSQSQSQQLPPASFFGKASRGGLWGGWGGAKSTSSRTSQSRSSSSPPPPAAGGGGGGDYNNMMTRSEFHDTPWNASRRPENHQCYAVTALILCFPLGLLAVIQSTLVDRAWEQGRFGDAVNHSRQASNYAGFGTFVGVIFWIYWLFFHEPRIIQWDWPNWNFD